MLEPVGHELLDTPRKQKTSGPWCLLAHRNSTLTMMSERPGGRSPGTCAGPRAGEEEL